MSDADRQKGRQHLLRKLKGLTALSDAEAEAILALPMTVRDYPAHHLLVREGDTTSICHLVVDGFASRHKSLIDGGRQILSFHTPGDVLDLQSLYLETADYGVSTVVPTRIGCIERTALQALTVNHPAIGRGFWRDTLVDAAIHFEWMLGLGRRSARTHLAHLLCEMVMRFSIVTAPAGASAGTDVGPMPLTRNDLADALGLATVEVNRELHTLMQHGLIEAGAFTVTVLDFEALARICDFNPTYLYQDRAA